MKHTKHNCGCGGTGEWAVWLDAATIAWPREKVVEGATYRLQATPQVSVTVGELTSAHTQRDARITRQDYVALHLGGANGLPLTADQAGEILRGPLRLEVLVEKVVVEWAGIQIARVLDAIYPGAARERLGLTWDGTVPTLKLWAPTAIDVSLCLWMGEGGRYRDVRARRDECGVWTVVGDPTWENAEFLWEVRVYVPSVGTVITNRVTDPYSVGLTVDSERSVIVQRSSPLWTPAGWGDALPAPLFSPARQSIYELHVRDFSAWDDSVPEELRGTYRAFTLPSTNGVRALKDLVDAGLTTLHLLPTFDISSDSIPEARTEQLQPSVHGVPLLPENEAALEDVEDWSRSSPLAQEAVGACANKDAFNWGYDPQHWMTPEGSYASPGYQVDGARTLEYREMILALHRMGLRVVQDVVFNHTFMSGQGRTSVLDKIVPGYYHRLNRGGAVETSTCCANVATEHVMAEKMMVDAIVDAAVYYHIDGFRFDLMGHHSLANMLAVRGALDALTPEVDGVDGSAVYLYGEGWNFGEVADDALFVQATQKNIGGTGIGVFNDRLRDAVRGGSPMDGDHRARQGFATGQYLRPNEAQGWGRGEAPSKNSHESGARAELYRQMDLVKLGLIGAIKGYPLPLSDGSGTVMSDDAHHFGPHVAFAEEPAECVNYVEAHDDESLYDSSVWKLPLATPMEDRVRAQVLANATVALGQGVAFWASGTELMRSKSLDGDSYNSGDWFNAIDWTGHWNQFGRGLPSAGRNAANWPDMAPLLDRPELRPTPEAMAECRAKSLELLRLRASSPLFTLGSAKEIRERVRFLPTGGGVLGAEEGRGKGAPVHGDRPASPLAGETTLPPDTVATADLPGVIAMWVDGSSAVAGDRGILTIFNATEQEWQGRFPQIDSPKVVAPPLKASVFRL